MKYQIPFGGLAVAGVVMLTISTGYAKNLKKVEITDDFEVAIQRCLDAAAMVDSCVGSNCNAYLPLEIGRVWTLDNSGCDDCDEPEAVQITVRVDTRMVDGISTRVYEEREFVDGELAEVSWNFLTQCGLTQDVIYWGEEVCVAEDSDGALDEEPFPYDLDCEAEGLVPGGGAWIAEGENQPGILFPGTFLIGARYFQELADNALDWAENVEQGISVDDPANGEFEDCVLVLDRNFLEDPKGKEADEKVYCPEIGLVQDEELELTSCTAGGGGDCAQ